jgi:aspartyl-tRNA(Asn)/glutamyl-tRNA(Gln) amidotransferase subunit A
MKSVILTLHDDLINNRKTISDLILNVKAIDKKIESTNSTLARNYDDALKQAVLLQANLQSNKDNLLYGIPFSLKDSISTKDIISTGGSSFLKEYVPPYNATVYELLLKSNAILTNKSNCDEFGLGGTGRHSGISNVCNVLDHERITGGSSSGSTNEVASGMVPFSVATDTGDSIRRPAIFLGIVGYKPTYGVVSRYGIFPYSPSLDHVGVLANTVTDIAIVMQTIASYDEKDYTSQEINNPHFYKNLKMQKSLRICVFKNVETKMPPRTKQIYLDTIEKIKHNGHTIVYKEIDELLIESIIVIYQIITYGEACSCWANLTGIHFGLNLSDSKNYEEMIYKNRTAGLQIQFKRRLTIGAYVLKAENFNPIFQHSKKIRTLIINTINDVLKDVDAYLLPGASDIAPKINETHYKKSITDKVDDLLLFANFAGLPSISIPVCNIEKMP